MDATTAWLLEGDPAIRWQTRRDLLHEDDPAVAADRDRVEQEGWGARLLDRQDPGGTWGGAVWKQREWDATDDTVLLLALLGARGPRTDAAIDRVASGVDWGEEWGRNPFFRGEEEPCINGRVLTAAAAFGRADDLTVELILSQQQDDGGWNCYARSPGDPGSFNSTICVIEGLAAYRDGGGTIDVAEPLRRGQEYLLERRLLRRRSTGELVDEAFLRFAFPYYWHYDVLRGLDHLRASGAAFDDRAAEAVSVVADARGADGRWVLDATFPGDVAVKLERVGEASRWITLRALRVLEWAGVQSGA
ncbi:hypothetical protein [Leifsonia sp. AG29]|uniref:hypothetical protein n=1 Tax=Leifsonia sp. AG29 TaxID=2598860 RepID=UPI00131C6E8C|nr:hypothetical protein [Leifsonia sp. AG29]